MTDYIIVDTIEGLYDERVEHMIYNINDRRLHALSGFLRRITEPHEWTNAALHWDKVEGDRRWSVGILTDRGSGPFGCVRFCKRCKLIDCPHFFKREDDKNYEKQFTPYSGQKWSVSTCTICGRRILFGSGGYSRSSKEADALIARVAESLGRRAPGWNTGYGSAWICELPACISQVIDTQGEAVAERMVRDAFAAGDSSVVTRSMMWY